MNYEYICAGIILLLILSVTDISMFNLVTNQLTQIEQEKGLIAEEILDVILLSPGDPPNWGNYSTAPSSIGFAAQNSLEEYVLDANKVVRMLEDSVYYISPGKARVLLGLSSNFQFSLRMMPVFIIDISSEADGIYTLTLTNHKGLPIPNVNITGFYVPKSLVPGTDYPSTSKITGINGTCVLSFNYTIDNVLVVLANQLDFKVLKTETPNSNVIIEGGVVMESDVPLVQTINYTTGSVFGLKKDSVFRYVTICGFTYYVEFTLWS